MKKYIYTPYSIFEIRESRQLRSCLVATNTKMILSWECFLRLSNDIHSLQNRLPGTSRTCPVRCQRCCWNDGTSACCIFVSLAPKLVAFESWILPGFHCFVIRHRSDQRRTGINCQDVDRIRTRPRFRQSRFHIYPIFHVDCCC